jgi:hypothetical protein
MVRTLEEKARDALDSVRLMGIDWIKTNQDDVSNLQHGLDHGLFNQKAVDEKQLEYRERRARNTLDVVRIMGVDWVKTNPAHEPHLKYGLENGLFSQLDVDGAQGKYEATH